MFAWQVEVNICRPCGYGKYQPEEGSFSCRLCGIGKTTRTKVAVSEEECRDECADGKQLAQDGTCEPCMLGTYRKKGLHLSCERCPDKTTTPRYSQVLKSPIQSRLTFYNQHYIHWSDMKWTRGNLTKFRVFACNNGNKERTHFKQQWSAEVAFVKILRKRSLLRCVETSTQCREMKIQSMVLISTHFCLQIHWESRKSNWSRLRIDYCSRYNWFPLTIMGFLIFYETTIISRYPNTCRFSTIVQWGL